MFKSLMDFHLHGNMNEQQVHWSKNLMPTKNTIHSKDEKLIEFLTEDFRDTAMHLRDRVHPCECPRRCQP